MKFWEMLDRMHARYMERPSRPLDVRAFVGVLFLAGYYWMVYQFSKRALPTENLDLIRDAMLTLGPPVGIIVGALFRTDIRDELATQNTGKFADAAKEQAKAVQAASGNPSGGDALHPGDTVQLDKPEGERR